MGIRNAKRHSLSRKAMTILEMVLAMSIVAIIFAAALPQFRAVFNTWDTREGNMETLQNARVLLDHVKQNLTKAARISDVSGPATTSGYIEYEDADENTYRYEVGGNNYVQFGQVGALYDLAGPVSQFQFSCYDACDLDTTITDVNSIRFVTLQTTLPNPAAMSQDKTFTVQTYLRTSAESVDSSLVGWWKLDESSGLVAADSSGNENDGTLTNMAGDEWTTGRVEGGLEFDGDNDAINGIGDCPTGNFTLACWAKETNGGEDWKTIYSAEEEIWLGVDSDASPTVWFWIGDRGGVETEAGTWTLDTWHHIAGTWDGTTVHLYIDGVDTGNASGTPENPLATAGVIGAWSLDVSDDNWFGLLDDVRIYNRALSAEEITQLADTLIFRQFTEAKAGSDTTSIAISTPANTNEGDLLIAAVVTDRDNDSSMSPPAGEGWTEIDRGGYSNEVTLGVWWKLAEASESSSHEFTWSSSQQAYAWMMRFTGHNQTAPINASAADGGDAREPECPSVTTLVENALILRIGGFDDDDIEEDNPKMSGHTTITMDESNSGDGTASGAAAYVKQEAVGDSETADFDLAGKAKEQYRTVTVAIAPAGGGGGIRP